MKQQLIASLCVMACAGVQVVNAQQVSVAGKITDQQGAPIQGVTVAVKGTKTGTKTNANGLFSINADQNATLLISAVGYSSQEVKINGRKTIAITLDEEKSALDEVMVVAYGTAKKSTFTGSASTVSAKDIKDVPTTSFEDALRGKVPGMQITSTSGQAGSTSSVRIRGIGSMNASNEPLYVIDGIPVVSGQVSQMSGYTYNTNNVMSTLNPNDIESVTVLKDAAASSLYGSRAANGVVIITTKKGKTGAPKINFKSSLALSPSWATDNYEKASPQDQINLLYSILYDSRMAITGKTPEQANEETLMRLNSRNWTRGASFGNPTTSYGFGMHGYEFSTQGTSMFENVIIKGKTDGVENRDGLFYDWDKELFRTGKYNVNDISISGGTENTNYFSSLGYTSDKGRLVKNDYERFSGRVNLNQKIGSILEFGINASLAKTDLSGLNDTRNTSTNYLFQSRNLLWPFYWPTDYKTGQTWTNRYNSYAQNVPYYNNEWENSTGTRRISATPSLLLKVLPELNIRTIFSYDETNTKDDLYYSAKHYTGQTDNGIVHAMVTNYQKLVSSTTANYNKSFGSHNLGLLIGWEAEKNTTDFVRATGRDLPSSTLHTVATAGKLESQAYSWGNSMLSALSRAEYNFDEKYFASASFRRDGSSKLGPEVRWGNFWSIGGAWTISKESFMSDIESINSIKIRGSYGINGTLPTDNNAWRGLVTYGNKYMEKAGGGLANSPNPDLTWETNYNTTVGVEFGLFNNKLFGSIEYYNRDSKDLIQDVPQSTVTGFSSTVQNIGKINNKGFEFLVGSDIIQNSDWKWTLSINAATLKSKVIALNNKEDFQWSDPTGGDGRARYIYREGESTLSFYGLEWAGVDQTNGKNVWYMNDDNNPNGDFEFNGRAATYTYTKAQRKIIGDGVAQLFGGINSNLDYKDFSLGLNFNYRIGGKLYDSANKDVADDGYYWERIHSQIFAEETWSPTNNSGTLPMVSGRDLEDVNQISSRHLYDATFIRLKNISFAYNIPSNYLKSIKISNARVFFNGSNLLTFSKFKNADPEVNQYSTRGWETPLSKIYTFGIDFSF